MYQFLNILSYLHFAFRPVRFKNSFFKKNCTSKFLTVNYMYFAGVMHQIKKLCEPEALDLSAKKTSAETTPSSSTAAMVPALASDLSGGPPQPGSSLAASLLEGPGLAMAPAGYELSPQTLPVPDASKQGSNGSSGSPRL